MSAWRAIGQRVWLVGLMAVPLWAAESDEAQLGTVRVRSEEHGRLREHEIVKTEVLSAERIQHKRAQTLAEAVVGEVGVDAQNSCANCGSKRITINGLRAEHTTVLIDGVPLHSAISSFYAMDAIPVVGIESIEISRGAGASLIAPEAIGGVLNIITRRPTKNSVEANAHLGEAGTRLMSVLGTAVGWEGRLRLLLAGQLSALGHWDVDGNGVSEAPELANESVYVKGLVDISANSQLEWRFGHQKVDILGGTVTGFRPTAPRTDLAEVPAFELNDVHRRFLGSPDEITDSISLHRLEGMARWKHQFSSRSTAQWTLGLARQSQSSLYMHGYDYSNEDRLAVTDGRWLFSPTDHQFFTLGVELKNQDMASRSEVLYNTAGLVPDDFGYRSRAAYLQHVWVLGELSELSTALRADQLHIDWQGRPNERVDAFVLAPRIHAKLGHGGGWTSRLMYGRGYRPPLSFFESQHGLNESGFEVQINQIETSHGLGYSLNYSRPKWSATFSSHYSWVQNLAYADWQVSAGEPAVFRNYPGEVQIWASDLALAWNPTPQLTIQIVGENFSLPDSYKRLLPAAAVEHRARLMVVWHFGDFEWVNTLSWVGARNLTPYGYDQHYRTLKEPDDPLLEGLLEVDQPKAQSAPAFFTWDIYFGWNVRDELTLFASVQNVLGFTQAGAGDSPLNWSAHTADRLHFHLDNNHTWGPLRGRVFTVGLRAQL